MKNMSQFIQIGAAIVIKKDIKSISPHEKFISIFGYPMPQSYDVIITMTDGTRHIAMTGTYNECFAFIDSVEL